MKQHANGTTTPIVRRLSLRLKHLYQWVLDAGDYEEIWDLCCDHGRLGLHLHHALSEKPSKIHLIDCVPRIIDILKMRYSALFGSHLIVDCMDAGDIYLPNSSRQLIILAGIGGETMIDILKKLIPKIQSHNKTAAGSTVELMLSPNSDTFELRRFLRAYPFVLVKEEFVTDKGQHHEHLHFSYHEVGGTVSKTSFVGERLWDPFDQEKKRYVNKLIKHYRNCAQFGNNEEAKIALDAYVKLVESNQY